MRQAKTSSVSGRRCTCSRRTSCASTAYAVEAQDVLREQVHRRPETLEVFAWRIAQCAAVIDECIRPDVRDLLGIPGDRHAPGLRRAADREVAQTAGDEAPRLVVAVARKDEVRVLVVEL